MPPQGSPQVASRASAFWMVNNSALKMLCQASASQRTPLDLRAAVIWKILVVSLWCIRLLIPRGRRQHNRPRGSLGRRRRRRSRRAQNIVAHLVISLQENAKVTAVTYAPLRIVLALLLTNSLENAFDTAKPCVPHQTVFAVSVSWIHCLDEDDHDHDHDETTNVDETTLL